MQAAFEPDRNKENYRYYWLLIGWAGTLWPSFKQGEMQMICCNWFMLLLGAILIDFCACSLWASLEQGELQEWLWLNDLWYYWAPHWLISVQAAFETTESGSKWLIYGTSGCLLAVFFTGSLWTSSEHVEPQEFPSLIVAGSIIDWFSVHAAFEQALSKEIYRSGCKW